MNLAERLKRTRSVNLTKAQLSVLSRLEVLKFIEVMIERIYPMVKLLCRQTEKG
jgi:uncharacterized protein YjaG (DUF416 family)